MCVWLTLRGLWQPSEYYVHYNTQTKISTFPNITHYKRTRRKKHWKISIWFNSTFPPDNWINRALKSRRRTCFLILLTGQSKYTFLLRWMAYWEWEKKVRIIPQMLKHGVGRCELSLRWAMQSKIPVRLALLKFFHLKLSHRKIIPSSQQMAIIVIAYWMPALFQGQCQTHHRL